MSEVQRPPVPLSVMDFDLSQADDTERCRAQLLIYHYIRIAPSLNTDMQQVLSEVLICDKPWRNTASNVPSDGAVSVYEMWQELHTRRYFPYWFVVAVCWGPNHPALQRIRQKMSKHLGFKLPDDSVIYPGGKTLLDFDVFCGEVGTTNEEYETTAEEEEEEEAEYDFERTAEIMSDLSVSSTAWEQTNPVVQSLEQTITILEAAIEALQKEMWDLKARVSTVEKENDYCRLSGDLGAVYQIQQEMAAEIAELRDRVWGEECLDEEECLDDDELLGEDEPLGEEKLFV
ncbi:hypothetical protein B0J13DRAFT_616674 [Dactylonectria estremocensis]|uniref:Uncharacterized protein n=1 Tax=Dactylonectria estremocensis TaxID=1079267 RepID=A0A9P9FDW1_9HYPO|nr:hypothetical protein B0J13DRAFT_616674 [Dactylonectria estremocensis]